MKESSIKAVTFTNKGYIEYTHNLLLSIENNDTQTDLEIFTLDDDSSSYFKNIHNNVTSFKSSFIDSREKIWKQNDSDFGKLMMAKFEIIYESLKKHEKVLYIDGDIKIKKNFNEALDYALKENDIIFQNDKRPSKPNEIKLCAGFMLIKSNKKTQKFFNPKNVPFEKILNYKAHDQTHINKSKNKFKYKMLPLHLFPNGPYFYENAKNIDPFMIHFNFLIGHDKKEKMKMFGEWYLND